MPVIYFRGMAWQ